MATYSIKAVQKIPISKDRAWDFFSNPANLQTITPDKLGFNIVSKHHSDQMYPGQIIEYKLRPLLNIPIYWMTEITHVQDKLFFIDEQRFGPYALWHHQHHFKEVEGGVEMTDIVHYRIPLWILGDIAHALFVKNDLQNIFAYRFEKVEALFGSWPGGQQNIVEFN
ncbi:MAG: SRPBCC family protein [Bacteroidetes bacterium]|jgi:ligand-binding SRPBCC domain-containing protein|nr:SRPBCC family protein [Bacteroidota bacterium]